MDKNNNNMWDKGITADLYNNQALTEPSDEKNDVVIMVNIAPLNLCL